MELLLLEHYVMVLEMIVPWEQSYLTLMVDPAVLPTVLELASGYLRASQSLEVVHEL